MATAALSDWAEMLLVLKPYVEPSICVARRSCAVTSEGLAGLKWVMSAAYGAMGRSNGVLNRHKCSSRRTLAKTGHRSGSPDHASPMILPRTPFIWVVNSSVTKVADHMSWTEAVACGLNTKIQTSTPYNFHF